MTKYIVLAASALALAASKAQPILKAAILIPLGIFVIALAVIEYREENADA